MLRPERLSMIKPPDALTGLVTCSYVQLVACNAYIIPHLMSSSLLLAACQLNKIVFHINPYALNVRNAYEQTPLHRIA